MAVLGKARQGRASGTSQGAGTGPDITLRVWGSSGSAVGSCRRYAPSGCRWWVTMLKHMTARPSFLLSTSTSHNFLKLPHFLHAVLRDPLVCTHLPVKLRTASRHVDPALTTSLSTLRITTLNRIPDLVPNYTQNEHTPGHPKLK